MLSLAACTRNGSRVRESSCTETASVLYTQRQREFPYTLLSFMNSSGRSVSSLSLALMITSPSVACRSMMILVGSLW